MTAVLRSLPDFGKELVAFETAYKLEGYKKGDDITKVKKIKIAEHKDIDDEGQTVKITEPGTPVDSPETGDNMKLWIFIGLFLAAFIQLAMYAGREAYKAHKHRLDDREMLM